VDDPWLDEALTQYSSLLYHEVVYGPETAADILERDFVQVYDNLVEQGEDMPACLPVASYDRRLYSPIVYHKAPLYFHALRQEVGEETFFRILRTYYSRNRYGIATPDSWLTAVQIVSGDPHAALFEQWIRGTRER